MNRQNLFQFLLFLSLAAFASAAAPENVDDCIFYEDMVFSGLGPAQGSGSSAVVLHRDGTFSGLFRFSRLYAFPDPYRLSDINDGTYRYRRIDTNTAELDLGYPGPDGTNKRTLAFTGTNTGTITGGLSTHSTFELAPPASRAPLLNCSNRSFVRPGGAAFTGFVIAEGEWQAVLVRAVGPGLAPFGITNALRDPKVTLHRAAADVEVAANDDWASGSAQSMRRTGAIVGAFALPENSKDAGVIVRLTPGNYVAEVRSSDPADSGQILLEVYLLP